MKSYSVLCARFPPLTPIWSAASRVVLGAALGPLPSGCTGHKLASCKVHVNYHGCSGTGINGPRHVGYSAYGESNGIVIVYPQARPGAGNPTGCWDWTGVTGKDFGWGGDLVLNAGASGSGGDTPSTGAAGVVKVGAASGGVQVANWGPLVQEVRRTPY